MKTIIISEFKAKCISLLKEVDRNKESFVVTRRGHALAVVTPVKNKDTTRIIGALEGTVSIRGDLIHTDMADEWEMDRA